jgi:DNA (cytosine-5)-methyltransferase 1
MAPLRIGSLFTGTGALDLAVMDVYDAEVVWHSQYEPPDKNGKEDTNQYAAKILARHWPDVPNLWDITKVDWQAVIEEHGPVDILTGGFPCQDVSSAGRRAGLTADSRSGLWAHFARAIYELNPRLVVIENVEGLLSAPADRGLGLDAEALEEEAKAGRVLRALGAVLGDLATLGFHAEWERVGADEVGAPHRRRRIIIYAWPAALDPGGLGRWDGSGFVGGLGAEGRGAEAAADSAHLGHERGGASRRRGPGSADGDLDAADAAGEGREGGGLRGRSALNGGPASSDAHRVESERRGVAGVLGGQAAAEQGEGDQRERAGHTTGDRRPADVEPACPTCGCGESFHDAGGFCAGSCGGTCTDPELGRSDEADADAQGDGRDEGRAESARQQGRPDASEPGGAAPADPDSVGCRADVLDLRPGQPDLDWGDYGPAIRRWEAVLGRPAPWPTDALGRLSPVFTEWLMGLPDGWVTNTPGLTRPAMLRALGNGVVWQQAAHAIRWLHQRASAAAGSAAA